jgi:peroxiredoxin
VIAWSNQTTNNRTPNEKPIMIPAKNMFIAMVSTISASLIAHAADIGQPAPDFSTKDAKGAEVSLAKLKGKVVVLEWVNHGCPFVVKHYGSQNMQKLQESYTSKGVVWITINSGSKTSGSFTDDATFIKMSEEKGSKATHLVADETGVIGKSYGAKTTPHMIVITAEGLLAYNGAIDSKKSTNAADIAGSENYVAKALDEVLAGKPVTTSKTEPYGCGVKY